MIPQEDPITPPTIADVGDMESNSTETQGAHATTPSLFEHPPKEETPPVEPIALPTKVDVGHTLPDPADTLVAVPPGPPGGRKVIGHQDTTKV